MSNYLNRKYSELQNEQKTKFIESFKGKKSVLKCLTGTAIYCFVLGILLLGGLLFKGKQTDCGGSGQKDCFSAKEWKFIKFVAVVGIVILIVKLVIVVKLYRAISANQHESIRNMLKVIVALFIINSLFTLYMGRKQMLKALIEIIVGAIITGLFVWYANDYAKIIEKLNQEGENPNAIQGEYQEVPQ